MEKLLNLLQDFYGENRKFSNDNGLLTMTNGVENLSGAYAQTYIISLKGGFIKWLVENDKIDFELDSIIHKHKGIDFNTGKGIVVEKLCNRYESLLMLLSISDTPIDDLISYLK